MQIEIKIDAHCAEPKLILVTSRMTAELQALVQSLGSEPAQVIAGFQEGRAAVLTPDALYRVYASNGKVYAQTEQDTYTLRLRLYEMEQRLAGQSFVRISNAEIINLKKVKGFDLSFTGTICVTLANGTVTYVSRRYVSKIKHVLGL